MPRWRSPLLEDLPRARPFFAEHPARLKQVVAIDGLERSELVRTGDHQDKLIDSYRDLDQERLVNVTFNKAEIGGAIEHGARNL
jgi:hypothetical protein